MEIAVTDHAVERFRERVRPALSFAQSEAELLRLTGDGTFSVEPPDWALRDVGQVAAGYVEISDGVMLVLERQSEEVFAAVTCVSRACLSDDARRLRNERRAARRYRRRAHRQKWRSPLAGQW